MTRDTHDAQNNTNEMHANNSPFHFAVNRTTKTVSIDMEFMADRSIVWDAFTKQEMLDQWYAPKPWISRTKFMDFTVGGRRFYAMVGPEGQEIWSIQAFTSISPKSNFKMFNAFADEHGNPELPGSDWDLTFAEQTGSDGEPATKVRITIYNESLERLEKLAEGFKIGMTLTFETLKNLLATLSKK